MRELDCSADWRLVYRHDADGDRLAGSKEALFDAVRSGAPVRFLWGFRGERGGETRFESKGSEFQSQVRQGFLTIAEKEPKRCVVIDARGSIDEVAQKIASAVYARLNI